MDSAMSNTRTVIAPWYGGKSKGQLPNWIDAHLERSSVYVEPYAGMASILLNREPAVTEVVNDLDAHIVHFFRTLRERGDELITALQRTPFARAEFEAAREYMDKLEPRYRGIDPVEVARCWYVCVAQSRAGQFKRRWKAGRRDESSFANRVDEQFPIVMERLRRVIIESMDGADVIRKYDGPDTSMYIDPPYPAQVRSKHGTYHCDTSDELHVRLLDAVTAPGFAAQCAISSYRNDLYDERLADWERVELPVCAHSAVCKSNWKEHKRIEALYVNRMPSTFTAPLF